MANTVLHRLMPDAFKKGALKTKSTCLKSLRSTCYVILCKSAQQVQQSPSQAFGMTWECSLHRQMQP